MKIQFKFQNLLFGSPDQQANFKQSHMISPDPRVIQPFHYWIVSKQIIPFHYWLVSKQIIQHNESRSWLQTVNSELTTQGKEESYDLSNKITSLPEVVWGIVEEARRPDPWPIAAQSFASFWAIEKCRYREIFDRNNEFFGCTVCRPNRCTLLSQRGQLRDILAWAIYICNLIWANF